MSTEQRQQDIITLAEAMELKRIDKGTDRWWPSPAIIAELKKRHPDVLAVDPIPFICLPEPFTSADDDYRVLNHFKDNPDFADAVHHLIVLDRDPTVSNTDNYGLDVADVVSDYKIGLWARAALEMLK